MSEDCIICQPSHTKWTVGVCLKFILLCSTSVMMTVLDFLSLAASLPVRGTAGSPFTPAGARALCGSLQFYQRHPPQAVRWHGVSYGWGGGQHHPGLTKGRTLEQYGPCVLHRYDCVLWKVKAWQHCISDIIWGFHHLQLYTSIITSMI